MSASSTTRDQVDAQAYEVYLTHGRNGTKAAASLGTSRRTLMRQVERHEVTLAQAAAEQPENPFTGDEMTSTGQDDTNGGTDPLYGPVGPVPPEEHEFSQIIANGSGKPVVILNPAGEGVDRAEPETSVKSRKADKRRTSCGFCDSGHHGLCPGVIENGSAAASKTWTCLCSEQGHTLGGQHREAVIERLPASARPAPKEARREVKKASTVFPEGVISPTRFRHLLVEKGLVSSTLRPQTVMNWVFAAEKGTGKYAGMPVRHYGPDGTDYPTRQPGPDGKPTTRSGIDATKGLTWYQSLPA